MSRECFALLLQTRIPLKSEGIFDGENHVVTDSQRPQMSGNV
jgi:hypothetical protein